MDFYNADAFLFYPHIKRMIAITGFLYTLLISSLRFEEASGLGKNVQTGRNSPTGSKEEASRLGENVQTGRNSPTGSKEEASGLGQKYPN